MQSTRFTLTPTFAALMLLFVLSVFVLHTPLAAQATPGSAGANVDPQSICVVPQQTGPAIRNLTIKQQPICTFKRDDTHQFFAESITTGKDGKIYAGVSDNVPSGSCYVMRFSPDGKQKEVIATLPPLICSTGLMTGIAFDEQNRLHVALADWAPGPGPGVYRVEHNGGITLVLSLPPETFPNGVAFYQGDLYVSDSFGDAIWKKGPHDNSKATTPWFQDWNIGWGPNGIAFYRNSLYLAVIAPGSILRIPLQHDGSPGAWEYVAPRDPNPDPRLDTIDGVAFDVTGTLWFVVNHGSTADGTGGKLATLAEDGTLTFLADNHDWLDYPTQMTFGTNSLYRRTMFLSNAGFNGGHSNILSFEVGVEGVPLPADR